MATSLCGLGSPMMLHMLRSDNAHRRHVLGSLSAPQLHCTREARHFTGDSSCGRSDCDHWNCCNCTSMCSSSDSGLWRSLGMMGLGHALKMQAAMEVTLQDEDTGDSIEAAMTDRTPEAAGAQPPEESYTSCGTLAGAPHAWAWMILDYVPQEICRAEVRICYMNH